MTKRIFIIADHGLALIYFLQSDVIPTLLKTGVEVVLFTDDESLPAIKSRYEQPGLTFEGIRLKECETYFQTVDPFIQRCLQMLRWVGGSRRINVTAMDGNYHLLAGGFHRSWTVCPATSEGNHLVDAPLEDFASNCNQISKPLYPVFLRRPVRKI